LRTLVCSRRHRLWVVQFLEFLQIVDTAPRLSSRQGKPLGPLVHSLSFRLASGADQFPWRLADWRSAANDTNLRCQEIPAVPEAVAASFHGVQASGNWSPWRLRHWR